MVDARAEAIRKVGRRVAEYRNRLGKQQQQIAVLTDAGNRSVIANLEEGRAMPSADLLETICETVQMPRALWYAASHPEFLEAMQFEADLTELVGKPITLDHLDDMSSYLCVDAIHQLFTQRMSAEQALAAFNSILTFYGERSVSLNFFDYFLGAAAFHRLSAFSEKVTDFQKVAIRIFGSFRQAFQTLRASLTFEKELQALRPVDELQFTSRRPFDSIRTLDPARLDDLGYISADRVKRESRERHEIQGKLLELAKTLRSGGPAALSKLPEKRLRRIQSLLRRFNSTLEIETTLFSQLDPDELEREATRLAPKDDQLASMEATQDAGRRNLTAYLTEPYMDVYVATSMREKADFVSVNSFVEGLFAHPEVSHLHLRFFNPTQSWIEDRVAKGLVEALMLRRSRLTVYMAQKIDTFGKDSEASVALGQGKPVVVYVPRLFSKTCEIDSESLTLASDDELARRAKTLGVEPEEGFDRQAMTTLVLEKLVLRLSHVDYDRLILTHWADFDLYGEINAVDPALREQLRTYLDAVIAGAFPERTRDLSISLEALTARLVSTATRFEGRAKTFREIHPLALQVILSSGVLNGILVVRSVETCAQMVNRLITNRLETELIADDYNYKLVEKITRSTLRVISKNRILTNAFWTQYFPEVA